MTSTFAAKGSPLGEVADTVRFISDARQRIAQVIVGQDVVVERVSIAADGTPNGSAELSEFAEAWIQVPRKK
jgi:hypothetical protein